MKRFLHLIGLAAITVPVWAGEYVVLGNGFRLHADWHEAEGATVRIFSGSGVTEISASAIVGYEQEEAAERFVPPTRSPPVEPAVPAPATPEELASEAARKYSLPGSFVCSVMKAESGFRANAVSPKGAIGLMQLMPGTARVL